MRSRNLTLSVPAALFAMGAVVAPAGTVASAEEPASHSTSVSIVRSLAEDAEDTCASLLANAGGPGRGETIDDDMALASAWAANLQAEAAEQLSGNPDASRIVAGLQRAAALNRDMMTVYNEHPVFSQTLQQDQADFKRNALATQVFTAQLNAPSCQEIVEASAA